MFGFFVYHAMSVTFVSLVFFSFVFFTIFSCYFVVLLLVVFKNQLMHYRYAVIVICKS